MKIATYIDSWINKNAPSASVVVDKNSYTPDVAKDLYGSIEPTNVSETSYIIDGKAICKLIFTT